MSQDPSTLVIIDGNNWMSRFFFGIKQPLTDSQGNPTAAIHGWMNNIWRVFDEFKPAQVVAVFDNGRCQHRTRLYPEYKATRVYNEAKGDLYRQIEAVKEICPHIGVATISMLGVEADDIIYTLAVRYPNKSFVMTNDKDLFGCIDDESRIKVVRFTGDKNEPWETFCHDKALGKTGVFPKRMSEFLALVGDSSDNIPGVPGVGPKTAAQWIGKYTLEQILAEVPIDLKPERLRLSLYNNLAQVKVAWELAKLRQLPEGLVKAALVAGEVNSDHALKIMATHDLKQASEKFLSRQKSGKLPF